MNDISYFSTITITTLTGIITLSSFTYIKNLYTQSLNKVSYHDKEVQTDTIVMIHIETQTDSYDNVNITNNNVDYNLEKLAKDQLIIQQNPSSYKWFFVE